LYGLALLLARADAKSEALALLITWTAYPADQEHARYAASLRAELERQLSPTQRAVASEWAQQRSLLPWLEEILARLRSEQANTPPLAATAAQPPFVSPDSLYITETGATLSPREVEVLRLLITGAGNQAIAATLIISPHTVKNHVASILSKLDVASRTQAALRGRELGLSPPTADR
jgi:DNA-binding NarL/FixJ family response regulator